SLPFKLSGRGKDDWTRVTRKLDGKHFDVAFEFEGSYLISEGLGRVPTRAPVIFEATGKGSVYLKNIKLKPLGLKPIFNGKNLTGWKEIKTNRTKSKFTVTDKGELNIKNGPGDIQTTGEWADFVLQLDVISNGPHLNSGVFFRCLPG